MSILVDRTASRIVPCLHPFIQTSRVSSRQFSSGPAFPLGTRLANSLATISTIPKYNFRNTINHTSHKSYLGYLVAAIVTVVAAWFFSMTKASKEAAAIAQKQGKAWECIGRTPDEFGGYIYHYKIRKEFDFHTLMLNREWEIKDIQEKFKSDAGYALKLKAVWGKYDDAFSQMGEAWESYDEASLAFEPRVLEEIEQIVRIISHRRFKDLGYGIRRDKSGTYLDLPDEKALNGRIEKKRETNPAIKQIKIFSSDENLDEMALAAAYLKYDIVLPPRQQFIHHHIAYALPTLNLMLSFPEEYAIEREKMRGIIGALHERIITVEKQLEQDPQNDLKNQLPKMKVILGTAVRLLWSFQTIGRLEELNPASFEKTVLDSLRNDYSFRKFWKKKFGEKFKNSTVLEHWKKITTELKELSTEATKIKAVDSRINP